MSNVVAEEEEEEDEAFAGAAAALGLVRGAIVCCVWLKQREREREEIEKLRSR